MRVRGQDGKMARGQEVYLAEVEWNNQHLVSLVPREGPWRKLRVLLQIGVAEISVTIILRMALLILFAVFAFNVEAKSASNGTRHDRGHIIYVDGEQIYLDLGSNHGIKVGMLFRVYRQLYGEKVDIAKIRITRIMNQTSIARILSSKRGKKIAIADRIDIIPEIDDTTPRSPLYKASPNAEQHYSDNQEATLIYSQDLSQLSKQDALSVSNISSPASAIAPTVARDIRLVKHKKHKSAWACLGAGIASLGGATYFKRTANNAYRKYEAAASLDDSISFRTKAQTNDMRAQITMGTSLLLIGVSIYLFQRDGEVPQSRNSEFGIRNSELRKASPSAPFLPSFHTSLPCAVEYHHHVSRFTFHVLFLPQER